MTIEEIQAKIQKEQYSYSQHAITQRVKRAITHQDVVQVINGGKIIEEYDEYPPKCLVSGTTNQGRQLHVVLSLRTYVGIITVYQPTPTKWKGKSKTKRKKHR